MSYRNNDIAACEGKNCPMRTTCLRWQLGQTMDDYQWWANFKPEDKGFGYCKHEIYNEPNNENENGQYKENN